MRLRLPSLVLLSLVAAGCIQSPAQNIESELETDTVARVIDGDTFVLANSEKVRLIGIDAPEKNEPCWLEAKSRLEQLVAGRGVIMQRDVSDRDKYGRLVRYVYVEGIFVNLAMVQEGFARPFEFEPDTSKAALFREAAVKAADANICLWRKGKGTN